MLFWKRINKDFRSSDENVSAHVLENGGCVYFYVFGHVGKKEQFASMAWLFNTKKAPDTLDQKRVDKGKQPKMPGAYCLSADKKKLLAAEYKVDWHEGNVVSLSADGRILAVIAEYNMAAFRPFSRFCAKATEFAVPMNTLPEDMKERIIADGGIF